MQQQMNQKQVINIHQLMEKFKSKREFYRFLQQNCKAYLPKIGSANIYFFKQILQGQKDVLSKKYIILLQFISRDQIKVSSSPHIDGLTVQDFLNFARNKPNILRFLPDERDWVHLERQWISDIIYTVDHDAFQNFIDEAIERRNLKLEQQQNLNIEIRPEFISALNECKQFSHDKGRSVFMIKDSSRRKRTHSEIEEVTNEEQHFNDDKQQFLREHKRLKTENQELQLQLQLQNNASELLNSLVEAGIINDSGEIQVLQQQQQQFQI